MRVTKNIFLDTSAIVQQNFNFSSQSMKRLEELAVDGEVNLLTTQIVDKEVAANIEKKMGEAVLAITRLQSHHSILKNLSDPVIKGLFAPFDRIAAEEELKASYREFLKRTKATTIPLDLASVLDIFDLYFSKRAPFGNDKKKSEFPDAFNISALENWCKSNREKLYVVTTDPDLIRHCEQSERLVRLSRPSEYVDTFLRESAVMEAVESSTNAHMDELENEISSAFEMAGFYLDDEDGDVNEVRTTSVMIDDISLLEVGRSAAKVEITGTIEFEADVVYQDSRTGIWDSEDKVLIGMETINTTVERAIDFVLIAEITLDSEGNYRSIHSITFSGRDFGLSAIEDDYPYK